MKKLVAILLALCLVLSVAACSSGSEEMQPPQQTEPQTAEENTKSPELDSAESETPEETKPTEETKPVEDEITFGGLVVVDNEYCAITIKEIDADSLWGYSLKAELENKSADKTYMFSVRDAAINGVQCSSLFASDVAPGKKSMEDISFSDGDLEKNGIEQYTDIELNFYVYDSDDWSADPVADETVHVYPYGEEKATKFVRESQTSDNVLIDNEYCKVIVTGYEDDAIWGYTANLYLENKTADKSVMFSVSDCSVNGYMADPFFATSVSGGKCAFSSMSWSDSTLEESGITDVEEIEFTLRVYDEDNWSADDFANEVITLKP